jgi:hypothetical protein
VLALAAALPFGLARFIPVRARAGHTAALRAAWWRDRDTLECRNWAWARLLSQGNKANLTSKLSIYDCLFLILDIFMIHRIILS